MYPAASVGCKPIVVVGSINMDLAANAERIPVPGETVTGHHFATAGGGKGANQAVAVARLGHPVSLIGCVGSDVFGAELIDHLGQTGLNLAGLRRREGPTGVAMIVVSESGENSIVVVPGANGLLTPEDLDEGIEMIRSAGMVLTQLEVSIHTVLHLAAICTREGIPLMLDPAPARPLPPELFSGIAWFTPNETEAALFMPRAANGEESSPGQIAEFFLSQGVGGVVLKLGARGAYLASRDGFRAFIDAFAVEAVDTTAAGDAFNGAFATALCMGMGALESARFAAAAAALCVTRAGAQAAMPTMLEVERLLDEAGNRRPSQN